MADSTDITEDLSDCLSILHGPGSWMLLKCGE